MSKEGGVRLQLNSAWYYVYPAGWYKPSALIKGYPFVFHDGSHGLWDPKGGNIYRPGEYDFREIEIPDTYDELAKAWR